MQVKISAHWDMLLPLPGVWIFDSVGRSLSGDRTT